ncbi:hypothetical protein ACIBJC_20045 [Streptomyces sp. NPDC050509]|uniref:hypothetical protein n=1 Tax=Streptomyces sp. NPDC050509 TaxID=3365620 RepID=UPI0037BD395F
MKTDIAFLANSLKLAGRLYTPDGAAEGRRRPAIVVGHPTTGVKEQTSALYAQKLVDMVPESVDDSTPALVREFHDYYKTPRAHHPRATNTYVLRSVDQLDQFDAYADVDKIAPRPLLMIAGAEAATLPFSQGKSSREPFAAADRRTGRWPPGTTEPGPPARDTDSGPPLGGTCRCRDRRRRGSRSRQ